MPQYPFPVFDGDGHVLETDAQLDKYFEGRWKGNRRLDGMTLFPSLDGWSRSAIIEEGDEDRRYWSTDARIWGDMLDTIGLEGSVLYPTAALAFGLIQTDEIQEAVATAYNNWLEAEYTQKDGRLHGVGLVSLTDVDAARKELIRCAEQRKNFPAILLPSVTHGTRGYGDEFFFPLYEEAERRNMVIALHGAPSKGFGLDHLKPFVKVHTLEHPVPLMIQLTDMMFSGVFETFPKLKFVFLEGGCSWVTFMMDRLDYEYDSVFGVPVRKFMKRKPSEIFRDTESIWVSCEMGEQGLKYVIDAVGADRVIYASDFPHEPTEEDMTADVPEFIANNEYAEDVKAKVLGRNAKALYNIN